MGVYNLYTIHYTIQYACSRACGLCPHGRTQFETLREDSFSLKKQRLTQSQKGERPCIRNASNPGNEKSNNADNPFTKGKTTPTTKRRHRPRLKIHLILNPSKTRVLVCKVPRTSVVTHLHNDAAFKAPMGMTTREPWRVGGFWKCFAV